MMTFLFVLLVVFVFGGSFLVCNGIAERLDLEPISYTIVAAVMPLAFWLAVTISTVRYFAHG